MTAVRYETVPPSVVAIRPSGRLAPRYSREQIEIWSIGPVIGTHGGPEVIGFCWQDLPAS